MTNNFLPFCPTDTATNLLTQAEYAAAADRTSGNQPGVASSKLNNKALRQGTFITAGLAQFICNALGVNVLDDGVDATWLAQLTAKFSYVPPKLTRYLTGSGTHDLTYVFTITSGAATVGATYTNNAVTFTVVATVAASTTVKMTGASAPAAAGTLTKASGTGDATLTFQAYRAPTYLRITAIGGGGGGAGSGTGSDGTSAAAGGDSYFRVGASPDIIVAGGGAATNTRGASGSLGGVPTVSASATAILLQDGGGGQGGQGNAASSTTLAGGQGGEICGGAGRGGPGGGSGGDGIDNTGGGGGGGGTNSNASSSSGGGGGAGAMVVAEMYAPSGQYTYGVGAGGAAGTAGGSGRAAGAGGKGLVVVEEFYQ